MIAAVPHVAEELGWSSSSQNMPEQFGENRSVQALAHFLHTLGTSQRPALIILDDCQWSDELTIKLIERWNTIRGEQGHGNSHVLLVLAFRSEEVPADHPLRRLEAQDHLRLGPFTAGETRQLAESMAGPLPDQAVDVVRELSGGSPFMASAVLHGLVESRALVPDRGGWRVEPLAIANLQSSSQAGSFLTQRIELLPQTTIQLLSSGAVLGKEFDLSFAARLACQTPSQSIAALNEARSRHMIWVRANGFQCVFVHDKIREALLGRMPPKERTELHRRAAVYLQHHAPERVSELAYHFDAAGDSEQALAYALEAAQQARARHALEVAEQQYRIAERGAATAPPHTRFQIVEGLGDVLMLRGRYDAAEALFEQAAALAEGRVARAQICGKLGELSQKRGAIQRAIEYIEEALRSLGQIVPRLRSTLLPAALLGTLGPAAPYARTQSVCPPPAATADRIAADYRPALQSVSARLLVRSQHLYLALGTFAEHELVGAISAIVGTGPRLFLPCRGDGSDIGIQPRLDLRAQARHALCPQVLRDPQVLRRSLGPRTVAALFRYPPLHGITLCPVCGGLPGSAAAVGTHRRLLGSPHRSLPGRRIVVSSG